MGSTPNKEIINDDLVIKIEDVEIVNNMIIYATELYIILIPLKKYRTLDPLVEFNIIFDRKVQGDKMYSEYAEIYLHYAKEYTDEGFSIILEMIRTMIYVKITQEAKKYVSQDILNKMNHNAKKNRPDIVNCTTFGQTVDEYDCVIRNIIVKDIDINLVKELINKITFSPNIINHQGNTYIKGKYVMEIVQNYFKINKTEQKITTDIAKILGLKIYETNKSYIDISKTLGLKINETNTFVNFTNNYSYYIVFIFIICCICIISISFIIVIK